MPLNVRSKQRVEAEQAWRDYARERGVPLFIVRLAVFVGGLIVFIWLMSKSSPILKLAGSIPHLPLYVIFVSMLVALGLRYLQENRARHG